MDNATPSSPRRRWLVPGGIGLLAGLIVGVLAGVFVLDGGGAGDGSADGDAEIACGYVASVSDDYDASTFDLDDPVVWRLQAIGPLAVAASKGDPRYEDFGELGRDLSSAVARVDTEMLESTLEALAERCGTF